MSYNCKNYTEQGGEKTVIGGTLEIAEGGKVLGLESHLHKRKIKMKVQHRRLQS